MIEKPPYKVGDVLRLTSNEWERTGYPTGTEAVVVDVDTINVHVEVTKIPSSSAGAPIKRIGQTSLWWTKGQSGGQAAIQIVSQITDEQVVKTKKALEKLLKQI